LPAAKSAIACSTVENGMVSMQKVQSPSVAAAHRATA